MTPSRYYTPREVQRPCKLAPLNQLPEQVGASSKGDLHSKVSWVCQVAQHCSPSDAWVSFLGQVYAVTELVEVPCSHLTHLFLQGPTCLTWAIFKTSQP